LVVATDEKQTAEVLSRHRLGQISELMRELVPEDRARLAALAAEKDFHLTEAGQVRYC